MVTYSRKMLANIGRIVVKKHPDIALGILEDWPTPSNIELSKLPGYFELYCNEVGTDQLKAEQKKVFVSAMLLIYKGQWTFPARVSATLKQHAGYTSRMIKEVDFRYKKDTDFKIQVDSILNKIK